MPRRSKYAGAAAVNLQIDDAIKHVWGGMTVDALSELMLAIYFTPATLKAQRETDGADMFDFQHRLLVERVWNRVVVPMQRGALLQKRWKPLPDDEQQQKAVEAIAAKVHLRNPTDRLVFLEGVDSIRRSLR